MSFLAGLARSSTQLLCERSLASRSCRMSLPVVTKTAVGVVKVRRNGTQTPDGYRPDNTKVWSDIQSAMKKVIDHRLDATPDQAWERRSAAKARLQQAPLPGPSTGKLARTIACLYLFSLLTFLLLVLLGRTVYVLQDQAQPFLTALNKLDQILRANYVRRELMESRFFIKGHVRRHKLNAIRWRRRFAQMVGPRNRAPKCLCLVF